MCVCADNFISLTRLCNVLRVFLAEKCQLLDAKVIFFLIFAQNIDRGCTLESPK